MIDLCQGNIGNILKNQHIFSVFFFFFFPPNWVPRVLYLVYMYGFPSPFLAKSEEGREQRPSRDQAGFPQQICKFELKPSVQANGFIKLSTK